MPSKDILICDSSDSSLKIVKKYIENSFKRNCTFVNQPKDFFSKSLDKEYDLLFFHSNNGHLNYCDTLKKVRRKGPNINTPLIFILPYREDEITELSEKDAKNLNKELEKLKADELCHALFLDSINHESLTDLFAKFNLRKKDPDKLELLEDIFIYPTPIVLIVEPEPHLSKLIKNEFHYETYSFSKSTDALEIYLKKSFNVSAVFIDIFLMDLPWDELVKKMRAISIIPNIILLGNDDNIKIAVEGAKIGASGYLKRPSSSQEFLKIIQRQIKNPAYKKNIEETKKWIGQEDLSSQELLNRLAWSIRTIDGVKKKSNEKNLLSYFSDFSLPAIKEEVNIEEVRPGIESYLNKKVENLPKGKMLIVDDEEYIRENLNNVFKHCFEIDLAKNGKEAFRLLCEESKYYDVVLLDVYLPDTTSDKLYPKLKTQCSNDLTVIIMTSEKETEKAVDFLNKGVFDYINKPIKIDTMINMVCRAWHNNIWPHMGNKLDLLKLSLYERLVFLNHLIDKKEGTLLLTDIACFFPEVFFQKKNT